MRMTFTVSAEQGIALLDLGRVYLTVDERVLRLRAVTKEGPTMTLEFEEDWSTDG